MSFLQRAYLSKAPGFQKNHVSALQKHVMVKASLKRTFEHARSNLKTTKNHWKRFRKTLALYQAVTFQWLHQLKFLWTTWLQHCQQDLTVQKLFSGRFSPFLKFRSWIVRKLINFRWKSWSSLNFSFTLNSWRSTTYEYQPMIVGMFELLFVFHCNDLQNI